MVRDALVKGSDRLDQFRVSTEDQEVQYVPSFVGKLSDMCQSTGIDRVREPSRENIHLHLKISSDEGVT